MRDLVEIGMGRTARRAYELDDIEIIPSRRTRSSKDVSTTWQIDAYRFDIPLITHPTDAIVSPGTAVAVGELGGLGVLNAEGLWARHADVDDALFRLVQATEDNEDPAAAVKVLQELHSAPLRMDLIAEAIKQVRESGVTVAARVSPQRAAELTPDLLAAGVEILVVQGTIISAEHVSRDGEPLNLKSFIADLDVPVIAGGVGDYRTAMHLMRTGAAGVIVGYGYAPGVTTTDTVLGIGVPMATAIADAAAARRDYLDETGGRYVHVIADGGVMTSGDVAKSIACGADAVMLGEPLAAATEAPGQGLYWTAASAHPSRAAKPDRRGRRPGARPAHAAVRAVRRPSRRDEPVRRAQAGHGEDRLLRPQGVPEGRPDDPRLIGFRRGAFLTGNAPLRRKADRKARAGTLWSMQETNVRMPAVARAAQIPLLVQALLSVLGIGSFVCAALFGKRLPWVRGLATAAQVVLLINVFMGAFVGIFGIGIAIGALALLHKRAVSDWLDA